MLMLFKPRPYQQKCFDNIRLLMSKRVDELPDLDVKGLSFDANSLSDRQVKAIMVASAPGSGKGDMLCWLAYSAWAKGGTVLIWVHRNELCKDLSERLRSKFGVKPKDIGYIMSGVNENRTARIQIASVMTKIRRDTDWLPERLVVLTDECHRILSPVQRTLLLRRPNARLVGFTATPFVTGSSKKEGFEKVFDCMIQLTTYSELVSQRFLLPSVVYVPATTANMDGVKIRMGEYDQNDLEKAFMEERLYAALFKEWKRVTGGRLQTMVFNISQKHNNAVNDFFVKHGINSVAIDDKTPADKRDKLIKKFMEGPFVEDAILVLNSVMLFTEGLDSPYCRVALLNYSTKSPIKYFQSSMRAGRPVWNEDYSDWLRMPDGKYYKDKVIVIDLGGNTQTHGIIDFYDAMGFDINGKRKEGVAPTKVCRGEDCNKVVPASVRVCPYCGHEFPPPKKKDDKVFLDEVGLKEFNKDQDIINKIIKLKNKEAERADIVETQWLRIVALIKRYDDRWLWARLQERGEYQQQGVFEWGNKPGSWKEYLENLEKEKGTFTIYERLKSKRLSI